MSWQRFQGSSAKTMKVKVMAELEMAGDRQMAARRTLELQRSESWAC